MIFCGLFDVIVLAALRVILVEEILHVEGAKSQFGRLFLQSADIIIHMIDVKGRFSTKLYHSIEFSVVYGDVNVQVAQL